MCLLVLFAGGCAPQGPPADHLVHLASRPNTQLRTLAGKCGGDFEKLTPQEQQTVQSMTGGHGAEVMRSLNLGG
jgi:hypothetical protein